jgi:hypothetical protein
MTITIQRPQTTRTHESYKLPSAFADLNKLGINKYAIEPSNGQYQKPKSLDMSVFESKEYGPPFPVFSFTVLSLVGVFGLWCFFDAYGSTIISTANLLIQAVS